MRAGSQIDLTVSLVGRMHAVVVDDCSVSHGEPTPVVTGEVKPIGACRGGMKKSIQTHGNPFATTGKTLHVEARHRPGRDGWSQRVERRQ